MNLRSLFSRVLCNKEPEKHFLFEYGDLMKNGHNNTRRQRLQALLLGNDPVSQEAYTDEKFLLFNTTSNPTPVAIDTNIPNHGTKCPLLPRRVRGELYIVDMPPGKLDEYRSNGVVFRRREVKVILPELVMREKINTIKITEECERTYSNTLELPRAIEAWMYVGQRAEWQDRLNYDFGFFKHNPDRRNTRPLPIFHSPLPHIGDYHFFNTKQIDT